MTTTVLSKADYDFKNPLSGRFGLAVFLVLFVVTSAILFFISSQLLDRFDSFRVSLLHFYLLAVVIGWFSYTTSYTPRDFFVLFLILCGLSCGGVLVAARWPDLFFWLILGSVVASALMVVWSEANLKGAANVILGSLYTTWITAGLVITLGSATNYLTFAKPALSVSLVHKLIGLRLLITILVALAFIWKSVQDSFRMGSPEVKPLPWVLDSHNSIINVLVLAVSKITNPIWKLVYRFATYVWRIGSNLAQNFLSFLLNSKIWLSILKVFATFIVVVILASIAQGLSSRSVAYLQSTSSPVSEDNLSSLGWFALMFVVVQILIIIICIIWDLVDSPDDKAVFCAVIILIIWAGCGLLMFALSRWDKAEVLGPSFPGVFSLTFWAVVIIITVINLAKGIALTVPGFSEQPTRKGRTPKTDLHGDAAKMSRRPLRRRLEIGAAIIFLVVSVVLYRSSLNQLRTAQEEKNQAQQLAIREQKARKEAEETALIEKQSRENAEKLLKITQDAKTKAEQRAYQCEQQLYEMEP